MRKFLLAAACFGLALVAACSGKDEPKAQGDSVKACSTALNPNGDSELAILMRKMANWNDSLKAKLQERPLMPAEMAALSGYRDIHTAQRTDTTIDKALFASMADLYLGQVDQFVNSGESQVAQVKNYNSMVRACISCHENFCHGPIKRINKMFVAEK